MPSSSRRGFTLLELSVVLALIGVIIGGGLIVLTASVQSTQFNKTVARMDTIDKTLLNYAVANNRVPCPSSLTITPGSANYGVEAATQGTCYGGTPSANFQASSGTVEGGVPTRALQLSDDYMYDGWGRRIRYAVDPVYTVSKSLPVASVCSLNLSPDSTAITVNDASGAARTNMGVYALISHGANGHGGYTSGGVIMNTGSTNTYEQTNCHCNSSAVATTYSPTYVQKSPTLDSSTTTDNFDDIVSYKEAWELQQQNFQVSSTTCPSIYVADENNYRVEKFSYGMYQLGIGAGYQGAGGTIGTYGGGGNGQFGTIYSTGAPGWLMLDASGNLYVGDDNSRIQKFSSSGAYISTPHPDAYGTGNGSGQFGSGATDSSGNFYVTDHQNYRVEKFNSNWVYQMTMGGDKGDGTHTCTSCGSTSSCTCYQGSGNGQLSYPLGIAVDASGNVYVADNGNARVVEFNSSGVWVQNIGSGAGSGNGQFGNPSALAIDPSGYLWVLDYSLNRVQKFSISGSTSTWLASLGGTSSSCTSCICTGPSTCPSSAGSGNGQLNYPYFFSFDSAGNLYVTDENNNRVEVFSNSGTFLYSIGGPSPYLCETLPASSSPSCAAGTGSGQFNSPQGIAVYGR